MAETVVADTGLTELREAVVARLGGAILDVAIAQGELTIEVGRETIVETMRELRNGPGLLFWSFIDLCGVDYPGRDPRFDVVIHLLSPRQNTRIRVRLRVAEGETVPSITSVFPGAEWFEREVWDMYGVPFTGHPDLRRLLTDYGFEGHPQRRDFPLTGYSEVRWDDELKRVVYEPVELRQEFRDFDFLSPWEGTDYMLPNEHKGDEKAGRA